MEGADAIVGGRRIREVWVHSGAGEERIDGQGAILLFGGAGGADAGCPMHSAVWPADPDPTSPGLDGVRLLGTGGTVGQHQVDAASGVGEDGTDRFDLILGTGPAHLDDGRADFAHEPTKVDQ